MQVFLPNRLVQDILRLPVLIAHYFHHTSSEGHIHFTDFISEHYGHQEHHENDHDGHDKLPFHHHDLNLQQGIFDFSATPFTCEYLTVPPAVKRQKTISKQHFHPSIGYSSIWRPPRFA